MNKHENNSINGISLPKRGDSLVNILGHPKTFQLPTLENFSDKSEITSIVFPAIIKSKCDSVNFLSGLIFDFFCSKPWGPKP